MNFLQHTYVLKNYLLLLLYSWSLQFTIFYYFFDSIIYFLIIPLLSVTEFNEFITSDLSDFFFLKLYIPFFFSSILTIFSSIFFLIIFLQPGLYKKTVLQCYIYFSILCCGFILNFFLFFKIIIQKIWEFFLSFQHFQISKLYNIYNFEPNLLNYIFFILKIFFFINVCLYFIFIIIYIYLFYYIDIRIITNNRKIFYWIILICTTFFSIDILTQLIFVSILILIFEILILFKYIYLNIFK